MNSFRWKQVVMLIFSLLLPFTGILQEKSTHLSFEELNRLEGEALNNNNIQKLRRLSEIHAGKARKEKNSIEVARAFYYRTFIEEPEKALIYADSIIFLTEDSNHKNYPTLGYILKARLEYESGKAQVALENFLKAYNLSIEKENLEHQREVSLAIAAIRNIKGQHSAAAELYRETLHLLQQQRDYDVTHYEDYITLLYNLSLTHLRLSQLDSAKYYVDRGMRVTTTSKDKLNYRDFVLVDAQLNYYKKNYLVARDTIQQYVDLLDGTSKAIKLYYLGKIEQKLGNNVMAVDKFLEIDSIVTSTGDPFNEIKDVYQQLIIHSSLEKNKQNQIYFIEKLIHYDSILSIEQQEITNQAIVAYDIPYLKHQKQRAEEQLRVKSAAVNGVGALAFLGICSGFFFYYRSRKMKNRLKILLEGVAKEQTSVKEVLEHPLSVPPDIRCDILKKLASFEESGLYLRKEIDLSTLAQEFGTNTSYLSTVINHYKKNTFPNYLKDLKISAAITQLKQNPNLLKYNYQGLAETFGFKTADSFSKAFYKHTGVYPAKFLNELKNRKENVHL